MTRDPESRDFRSGPPAPGALRRYDEAGGIGRLWYAFLAGILAWKLQLMVIYGLVPYACWNGLHWLIHVATALTIVMSLSGAWVGFLAWRESGGGTDTDGRIVIGRSRFMALSGMILGIFFAFVIFGQWLPNLMLGACDGIS
jgi:hypothetical protein